MRRILAFLGGVLSGGAIGTAAALLFTPASGDSLRDGLRGWWQEAIAAGREAAEQRRAELEAQFAELTGSSLTPPPDTAPDR